MEATITANKAQMECIKNTEGKYLVLAGPGTGKTYTVTTRIKHMIEEKNIAPETILCLTFTDTAANEMRNKLEEKIGSKALEVNIYTYHSFCNEIISLYSEDFELKENIKVLNNPSIVRALIKECIDELNPQAYRTEKNDPYFFIDKIRNGIEEIKKNRLTKKDYFDNLEKNPDWKPALIQLQQELKELIQTRNELKDTKKIAAADKKIVKKESAIEEHQKKIDKAEELWKFYELYSEKMHKKNYIDFNDMISLVLEKFETSPSFLEKIANNYKYILVDEYQDTNLNQNSIVFNLTQSCENVFVVGDDDQIIYSFQGAKLDTIENFLREFPETKVICLKENMRSTQNILNVSRQITNQDEKRLEINPEFEKYNISKDLISCNKDLENMQGIRVRCSEFLDTEQEYNAIVKEIADLINSDECPQKKGEKNLTEIAILTRTNKELEEFAQIMRIKGIPFELKEGRSIFQIKSSIILYFYMQFLTNPELNSDKIFKLLLSKPFSINAKDFEILYNEKSKYKCFIDIIRNIDKSKLTEPKKLQKFVDDFDYLSEYKQNENLKNTIIEIGGRTGIFQYYLNSEINKTENIAGIKKLVDEANAFTQVNTTFSLEDFVNYLDSALEDEIEIKTDKSPFPMNAVQLSTYYSAKGREFEYVYMPTLMSRKWESDSKSLKATIPLPVSEYKTEAELKELKLSDRIKVMYVGMTRAKHTLRLSYIQPKSGNSISNLIVTGILNNPNVEENICKINSEPEEIEYQEIIKEILNKRDYDYKTEFESLIKAKVSKLTFSPTGVNTYLNCPRQYFYSKILKLDSKTGNVDNANYGTAIHEACRFAFEEAQRTGEYPNKADFIEKFNEKLDELPLSSFEQRKIFMVRGAKALSEFYVQMTSTPISSLYKAEEEIIFEINGCKIIGKIDRIEKNEDGTYTICDYKTGNAKKDKDICVGGNHEDYYNQICLYKHFFESQKNKKVRDVKFIFPEDFENNLSLTITNEECMEVLEKFKKAIEDINQLNFEPTPSESACKYCSFNTLFCPLNVI